MLYFGKPHVCLYDLIRGTVFQLHLLRFKKPETGIMKVWNVQRGVLLASFAVKMLFLSYTLTHAGQGILHNKAVTSI